jgi:uncharacterized protein YacL
MNHAIKIFWGFFISIISFLFLYHKFSEFNTAILITIGIIFISTISIAYLEQKFLPKINSELSLFIGLSLFITLGIGFFLYTLIDILKSPYIALIYYLSLLYVGIRIGQKLYAKPGMALFNSGNPALRAFSIGETQEDVRDKILDTSVVIDGRILDIADTHFIDGPLILPNFVLREIQLISDSSDPIKRARGRRGLDMLNKLQRKGSIEVKITYTDYTDTREVDAKLIKLARDTGGKLVTNDFNLNKVAELQGVKVLNLNNLANALKPVVLPGEELTIQVIKEGKDENQGIGYLEDGTMVVIENGGHLVGKDVKVSVTSIIQTAAGKMIFTKAIR